MMHFRFEIVLILSAQALSLKPIPDIRIIGGQDANIKDYPYQVSLLIGGSHKCGGSIISSTYIITAAHCTDGKLAEQLQVRIGSSYIDQGDLIDIKTINQHPDFDGDSMDNDISILELTEGLVYGDGVQPVGLPASQDTLSVGTFCNISGWGDTTGQGTLADILQVVKLPVMDKNECDSDYQDQGGITDHMFCAGYPSGGQDACQGDSGGPLVVNNILYGIVSWGIGCAQPNRPGVYSNVPTLRSYITDITGL